MKFVPVEIWHVFAGLGIVSMIRGSLILRESMVGSADIAAVLITFSLAALAFIVANRAKDAESEAHPLRFALIVGAVAPVSAVIIIAVSLWLMITKG